MPDPSPDTNFEAAIAAAYQSHLVPLIFEPCAGDVAARIVARHPQRILEVAAGTGVLTRHLAATLPGTPQIVATDLNQAMLDQAAALGTAKAVAWRQADAMQLPFGAASFDVVACQFGVMFFPDKVHAFAEARRVLRPGGSFLFTVWDRIEENDFADAVTQALARFFPDDPPRFMARTPHGYHDRIAIERALAAAGFSRPPTFTALTARSRADSPRIPAIAYCQGTPFRSEIEARGPGRLDEATDAVARAIAERFGDGPVDGQIKAWIVEAER